MRFTAIALMSFVAVSFFTVLFVGRIAVAEKSQPLQALQTKVISPNPGEVLRPFNGKDLNGFTRWLQDIGTEDLNNVYSVVDGVLRISGEGMGYLATVDCYKNYHLSLEYRWGEKVDGSGNVRNSGILLHANGPDGNAKGLWMASVECQLAQGCENHKYLIPVPANPSPADWRGE